MFFLWEFPCNGSIFYYATIGICEYALKILRFCERHGTQRKECAAIARYSKRPDAH